MKNSPKADDLRSISVPSGRLARLANIGTLTVSVAGSMALGGVKQLGKGKRPSLRNLLLTPANFERISQQLAQNAGCGNENWPTDINGYWRRSSSRTITNFNAPA